MAQQALGAGTTVPRKRALFGALDADGWAWAGVKATFWLVVIIMMLGYIPDRAYYFTVNRTVAARRARLVADQLLPARERDACPARRRSGRSRPWHPSPAELALPEPRTDGAAVQLGTKFLYIGGTGADGAAKSTVYVAPTSGTGNFDQWAEGPALPEPRTDASVLLVSGSIYVIGGRDASGAPTRTIYLADAPTRPPGPWVTGSP